MSAIQNPINLLHTYYEEFIQNPYKNYANYIEQSKVHSNELIKFVQSTSKEVEQLENAILDQICSGIDPLEGDETKRKVVLSESVIATLTHPNSILCSEETKLLFKVGVASQRALNLLTTLSEMHGPRPERFRNIELINAPCLGFALASVVNDVVLNPLFCANNGNSLKVNFQCLPFKMLSQIEMRYIPGTLALAYNLWVDYDKSHKNIVANEMQALFEKALK